LNRSNSVTLGQLLAAMENGKDREGVSMEKVLDRIAIR
jgi:hypothetical protein